MPGESLDLRGLHDRARAGLQAVRPGAGALQARRDVLLRQSDPEAVSPVLVLADGLLPDRGRPRPGLVPAELRAVRLEPLPAVRAAGRGVGRLPGLRPRVLPGLRLGDGPQRAG